MRGIGSERKKAMRGADIHQDGLFNYISPESRIPKSHLLRPVRKMVDAAMEGLWGHFGQMHAGTGRPSIPPR